MKKEWKIKLRHMTYLIPVRMTTYDDGLHPPAHKPGDVFADDSFPEDSAAQNISDGAIGRLPHLFQLELLNPLLIGGDGGTLDANIVLLYSFCGVLGDLVVGGITILYA